MRPGVPGCKCPSTPDQRGAKGDGSERSRAKQGGAGSNADAGEEEEGEPTWGGREGKMGGKRAHTMPTREGTVYTNMSVTTVGQNGAKRRSVQHGRVTDRYAEAVLVVIQEQNREGK